MDVYPIALYAHFFSLVAATIAATYLHFSVVRLRRATTAAEAREAVRTVASFAPKMGIFALALFATGAYLVQLRWPWSSGWVSAAIVGLLSMPATSAIILKPRIIRLGQMVATRDGPLDAAFMSAVNDRVLRGAMLFNHLVALAVMFVMVTKPSMAGSFATLGVALVVAVASTLLGKQEAGARAPVTTA